MKISNMQSGVEDIDKIKNFLVELGFICDSYPSAQCQVYSKNSEIVIIKNNEKKC
jgi:hypothetical protein